MTIPWCASVARARAHGRARPVDGHQLLEISQLDPKLGANAQRALEEGHMSMPFVLHVEHGKLHARASSSSAFRVARPSLFDPASNISIRRGEQVGGGGGCKDCVGGGTKYT